MSDGLPRLAINRRKVAINASVVKSDTNSKWTACELLKNLEDAKIVILAKKRSTGTDKAPKNHEGCLDRLIDHLKDANLKLLGKQASENNLTESGKMLINLEF